MVLRGCRGVAGVRAAVTADEADGAEMDTQGQRVQTPIHRGPKVVLAGMLAMQETVGTGPMVETAIPEAAERMATMPVPANADRGSILNSDRSIPASIQTKRWFMPQSMRRGSP